MKFNNEATIYSIHVVKLICAVIILIVLTLLLTTNLDDFLLRTVGLTQTWTLTILIALYIMLLLYFRLRHTSYFSYNDDGSKIVIHSYLIGAGSSKRKSYEIAKDLIHKYAIEKKRFSEELTIYIRTGTKISKYPAVSISSITQAQKSLLIKSLNSYVEV